MARRILLAVGLKGRKLLGGVGVVCCCWPRCAAVCWWFQAAGRCVVTWPRKFVLVAGRIPRPVCRLRIFRRRGCLRRLGGFGGGFFVRFVCSLRDFLLQESYVILDGQHGHFVFILVYL